MGDVKLRVNFKVKLNMTEEEFDSLSEFQQNQLIEDSIDWHDTLRSAETEDIDVWDVGEHL